MIIDYYSEEFGHERKWMVDNNSWDIGSRKIVFAVFCYNIYIYTKYLSYIIHILHIIDTDFISMYIWYIRKKSLDRLKIEIDYSIGGKNKLIT